MSPLKREQLKQIRDERKEQIMEAALKVFARRGIIGTKMSMIAMEAKISQGLLYRYFESKDELFTTLVQHAMEESVLGLAEVYHIPGSPKDKLRKLTEHILKEENQLGFMLIHQARTSDEVPESAKQLIEDHSMQVYIDQWERLFREGQQVGDFISDDPRVLIANYITIIAGLMTLNIHGDPNYLMPDVDVLLRIVSAS